MPYIQGYPILYDVPTNVNSVLSAPANTLSQEIALWILVNYPPNKPQRIMQLSCLLPLVPMSCLNNEVLQRSLRPPSRKGESCTPVVLLISAKGCTSCEITGGAIAALSTWKTYQRGLINTKVKAPGFHIVFSIIKRRTPIQWKIHAST